MATGAHGWPLVPSPTRPGEEALACPACGGTSGVVLTSRYGPGGRLGDPGAVEYAECRACGLDSRYQGRGRAILGP